MQAGLWNGRGLGAARVAAAVVVWMGLGAVGCGQGAGGRKPGGATATGDLKAAIESRTEVTVLQQDCVQQNAEVLDIMRKVVAKADAKATEGNILLTKDRYGEAVAAFKESAGLYRQVIDGRKLLTRLADAERAANAARVLAEAAVPADKMADARKLQVNAEGYLQAGEFEAALAEQAKAQAAFSALLPAAGEATLETAVAARTAMLAARAQIKGLGRLETGEGDDHLSDLKRRLRAARGGTEEGQTAKPGSTADLVGRAVAAERAADRALEDRQYTPARALFAAAGKLYGDLAALQAKRDAVIASRQSVEQNRKLADAAFKGAARPASFERGKQALDDADKALAADDFETARKHLTEAAERFATARTEAAEQNAAVEAQQAWTAALAAADADLLDQHAAAAAQAARAKAAEADGKQAAGDPKAAAAAWTEAVAGLKAAVAAALTRENQAKAVPVLARLEAAIAAKNKFAAEDVLAELEQLIPDDARVPGLRERVAAVPGLKKTLTVSLGGGVNMEFVLVRPGSFQMGSETGAGDEKPVHKVTIAKAFYIGKYEVTQEQWQAVMGANPSSAKGPKLPVTDVSWTDCRDFAAKMAEGGRGAAGVFRLPTEAEWEYACRAGTTTAFCFGDSEASLGEYAWFTGNSGGKTHEVGTKKPNAWGLYDMHGNVREWCSDWYANAYTAEAATDPEGPAQGSSRVDRGGGWGLGAGGCRSAGRYDYAPGYRSGDLGGRLVLAPPVQQ
jgi:formylglycine-generating enzyme required for sulfatase activity